MLFKITCREKYFTNMYLNVTASLVTRTTALSGTYLISKFNNLQKTNLTLYEYLSCKNNLKLVQTESPNWRSGFIITGTEERNPSWNWGMERGSMKDLRLGGGNKVGRQSLLFYLFPKNGRNTCNYYQWIVQYLATL